MQIVEIELFENESFNSIFDFHLNNLIQYEYKILIITNDLPALLIQSKHNILAVSLTEKAQYNI